MKQIFNRNGKVSWSNGMHQFSTWRKSIWNWPQLSHHPGWYSLFICLSAFALISTAQYWSQAGFKITQNESGLRNAPLQNPVNCPAAFWDIILSKMEPQKWFWMLFNKYMHAINSITHIGDSTPHWVRLYTPASVEDMSFCWHFALLEFLIFYVA